MIPIHRFARLNCFFVWLVMFSFCVFSTPEPIVEKLNESVKNHMVEPSAAELYKKLEFFDARQNARIENKKDASSNKIISQEKPLNTFKKQIVSQPEKVSSPLLLTYDYQTMKNQESMLAPLKQPVEDTTESDLEFVDASNFPVVDFSKNIDAQDIAAKDKYSGINKFWDDQYQFAKRNLSIAQKQNELSPRNPVSLIHLQKKVQEVATGRQAAAESVMKSQTRRSPVSSPVSLVSTQGRNNLLLQPTMQGDFQQSMTKITTKKRSKLSQS